MRMADNAFGPIENLDIIMLHWLCLVCKLHTFLRRSYTVLLGLYITLSS